MPIVIPDTELRDPTLLRQHYELERALADCLRSASKQERRDLYSVVYDEYFSKVGESTLLSLNGSGMESDKISSKDSSTVAAGATFSEASIA